MPRTIKIDFYKTEDADGHDLDITGFLNQSFALPFGQRRVDFGDSFIFLHNVRPRGNHVLGEVVKAKMTDLPDKVSRNTGQPQDLGLSADEGIGRHAHFLYDTATRVLLLQRDRDVRPTAFRESVSTPTGAVFFLSLIFKRDALQRLNRMAVVRKITFKVARPQDPNAFRDVDASAAHLIDLLNDYNGLFIDATLSVGKSKEAGLSRQTVFRAARRFFGRREEEVRKVVVYGREDPEGATEIIDLFEDRLVFETRVQLRGRSLDPADCERALLDAHREHGGYLRNYRPPE